MSTKPPQRARRRVGRPAGTETLRDTLVETALALLEQTGDPAAISIQAIVDAAGCTPPSLYHYWPSRDALLREASARGWTEFQATQAAAVDTSDDPLERIEHRGDAYLAFALTRPSLFRVLFLERRAPGATDADPDHPGAALGDLIADVVAAMDAQLLRTADPTTIALVLWSAIHGLASLWASSPTLPHDLAWLAARIQQQALIDGLTRCPSSSDLPSARHSDGEPAPGGSEDAATPRSRGSRR